MLLEFTQANGKPVFINPYYIILVKEFIPTANQAPTATKTIMSMREGRYLYLQDTMRDVHYKLVEVEKVDVK